MFPSPAYAEVSIPSAGTHIVLSLWHIHPQAASVVFYPGTMASPFLYRCFLHALCGAGLNVVGIHLLSHGKSPRERRHFTLEDMVQNGIDAVSWVQTHWQTPVVIAGHSQGGILTIAHAARDLRPRAAFALCMALPQHEDAITLTRFARLRPYRKQLLQLVAVLGRHIPWLPIPAPCYLDMARIMAGAENLRSDPGDCRMTYPVSFLSSLFHTHLEDACTPGHIHCPVCVIAARTDALFTPALHRTMLDCLAAPHKELLLFSGGGHLLPLAPQRAAQAAAAIAGRCAALGLHLALGAYARPQEKPGAVAV